MIKHNIHSNLLQFESLNLFSSLLHFTTTIDGGVSVGNYASFNLGVHSGDDLNSVYENRNRLASMLDLPSENLIFPDQTHGDSIYVIDREFLAKRKDQQKELLQGIDALITNQPRVCIGVGTADCVPIIIFDPKKKVLATIHAGWRGTVSKLAEKVVKTMMSQFDCKPSNLWVGIGPSISPDKFEVGDEVVDAFIDAGFLIDDIGYYNFETNKFHIDLWSANKLLLSDMGIPLENIGVAGLCTFSENDVFFSARRQTVDSGRMITGGVLID